MRVLGRDPVKEHRRVTQSLGYLSQRFSLYGDLSIDENIAFFAEIHGLSMRDAAIRERRERLLELTQLTRFRSRLADQLSGGMKQKLALACTLVHEPQIILLDEPTTGVDPVSRREFWKLLSEFLAQGITILMATPYLDEAERCSRVALLHEGALIALDTPGESARQPSGRRDGSDRRAIAIARRACSSGCRASPTCSCSASARTCGSTPGSPLSDPERLAAALAGGRGSRPKASGGFPRRWRMCSSPGSRRKRHETRTAGRSSCVLTAAAIAQRPDRRRSA